MQSMRAHLTYPLVFEIKLDVLHLLYQNRPTRHSAILSWLLTLQKYQQRKPAVVKTSLAMALKNLVSQGVLKKVEKSHKFKTYSIRSEEKAKQLLTVHRDELFPIIKQTDLLVLRGEPLRSLHKTVVLNFADFLLRYERALCEAIVAAGDKSLFLMVKKSGRAFLEALWDSFTETLDMRERIDVASFYEQELRNMDSGFALTSVRTEKGNMVRLDSWIEAWKANRNAESRSYEYLQNSFRECLSKVGRKLDYNRSITEENLEKDAITSLRMLGARALSREDMERLDSMNL